MIKARSSSSRWALRFGFSTTSFDSYKLNSWFCGTAWRLWSSIDSSKRSLYSCYSSYLSVVLKCQIGILLWIRTILSYRESSATHLGSRHPLLEATNHSLQVTPRCSSCPWPTVDSAPSSNWFTSPHPWALSNSTLTVSSLWTKGRVWQSALASTPH